MESPERQFAFRLCLALGFPHPDYLLDVLTGKQVMEWRVFDRVEPIGGPAMDFRFGVLSQNVLGPNLKQGARMPGPLDFFPWHNKPEPIILPADELVAAFDRMFP